MGKKKNKKFTWMKSWPKRQDDTVPYSELMNPAKEILYEGYRLLRKNKNDFLYRGYNIGREELATCPSGEERFKEKWLENEAKNGRTLIDNIFNLVFQLGMEQGRRLERKNRLPQDILELAIIHRTEEIKKLRKKVAVLENKKEEDQELVPMESDNPDLNIEASIEASSDDDIVCEESQSGKVAHA